MYKSKGWNYLHAVKQGLAGLVVFHSLDDCGEGVRSSVVVDFIYRHEPGDGRDIRVGGGLDRKSLPGKIASDISKMFVAYEPEKHAME